MRSLTILALFLVKDPKLSRYVEPVYFIGGSFGFHIMGTVRTHSQRLHFRVECGSGPGSGEHCII